VRSLAEAVGYAHQQGIVHRDIKPHNVILDKKTQPHLLDFGLANLQDATHKLTQDGAIMGTPSYLSPEQALGKSDRVGPLSDQYSLGVVLYELMTGRTPFSGPPAALLYNIVHSPVPPPSSVDPQTPADLEAICMKALARDAVGRYETCERFAADLDAWLSGRPIAARPLSLRERFGRWCKANPLVSTLTMTTFLSIGGGLVATLLALRQAEVARVEAARLLNVAEESREAAESERARADERSSELEKALLDLREQKSRAEEATQLAVEQEALATERLTTIAKAEEEVRLATEVSQRAMNDLMVAKANQSGLAAGDVKLTAEALRKEEHWTDSLAAYDFRGSAVDKRRRMEKIGADPSFQSEWESSYATRGTVRSVRATQIKGVPGGLRIRAASYCDALNKVVFCATGNDGAASVCVMEDSFASIYRCPLPYSLLPAREKYVRPSVGQPRISRDGEVCFLPVSVWSFVPGKV